MATRDKVLQYLEQFDLKQEGPDTFRCNRPWSPGSDSQALTLGFDDDEHGAYFDHVSGEGGSLYQLAQRLNIPIEHKFQAEPTKKNFADLEEYAVAHGATLEQFQAAGWRETRFQNRPALEFQTKTGKRWRFLDGDFPVFKSIKGYKRCLYGLERAVQRAKDSNQPLIICGGEPAVVSAHAQHLPACCITGGEKSDVHSELVDELVKAWTGPVILAPDCDETGRKWAAKWLELLNSKGIQARAVDFHGSKGFDLADFVKLYGDEADVRFGELPDLVIEEEPTRPSIQFRWTADELLTATFPDPVWTVPGILPEGLTILGGRPKVGKSWLALQIAVAVASGGMVFDKKVDKGAVLYIALEDNPRRLQDRLIKIGLKQGAPIVFYNAWKPLHKGGLEDLINELLTSRYRFAVIDTLKRATPGLDPMKDQGELSTIFDEVQRYAIQNNIGQLINDHTRKPVGGMSNADPVDDILDTTAKTATADAILALYRKQGVKGAKLLGRGRDFEDVDLQLIFDPVTVCWQLEGNATEIQMTKRRAEVLDALKTLGMATVKQVTELIGGDRSNNYKTLNDLVNVGLARSETINGQVFYGAI
jgi:hypothetical protein